MSVNSYRHFQGSWPPLNLVAIYQATRRNFRGRLDLQQRRWDEPGFYKCVCYSPAHNVRVVVWQMALILGHVHTFTYKSYRCLTDGANRQMDLTYAYLQLYDTSCWIFYGTSPLVNKQQAMTCFKFKLVLRYRRVPRDVSVRIVGNPVSILAGYIPLLLSRKRHNCWQLTLC